LRRTNETQHTVTLTKGFYMSKYPVTQGEYLSLMGSNPSYFTGDTNRPVECVTWYDATNYCGQLTQQERLAGRLPTGWVYRLPTESEWEYACRAGTTTAFYHGNALRAGMANFYAYYEYDASVGDIYTNTAGVGFIGQTTPVGSYEANPWGLYDMCGNVCQWCQDSYAAYPTGSVSDPVGAGNVSYRMMRGGEWDGIGRICRSAFRYYISPDVIYYDVGFRPVLAPNQP